MNRWRQRLAELHNDGGEPPSPLPSTVQNVQNVQNPLPDPPFEHFEQIEQQTETAVPSIPSAAGRAITTWREAEAEGAAIVEQEGGILRIGVPQIAEEPVLLRDGRRMWRFRAEVIPGRAGEAARDAVDQARWQGCVLVADGHDLILVEPWRSRLSDETREHLATAAGDVIALLRTESAKRCGQ